MRRNSPGKILAGESFCLAADTHRPFLFSKVYGIRAATVCSHLTLESVMSKAFSYECCLGMTNDEVPNDERMTKSE